MYLIGIIKEMRNIPKMFYTKYNLMFFEYLNVENLDAWLILIYLT